MDNDNATAMLLRIVDDLKARGDFLELAKLYPMATDPVLKATLEASLNETLRSFAMLRSIWCPEYTQKIVVLIRNYDLPETTLVMIAGFLDRVDPDLIFALRDKSHSEKVTEACDDALVRAIAMYEYAVKTNKDAAQSLATDWKGEELSARVIEARDAALIRMIQKWGGEAKDENILHLSAVEGISSVVKDAAAAALSKLNNITEAEFSGAIDVLATCGKLDALANAYAEARLPSTKQLIENALDKAMDVAACLDWREDTTYNGHACSSPSFWYGQEPFKLLLQIDCPDPLKQKARRILEEGGTLQDPRGLVVKASENRNKADSCLRMARLYLLQERHRNRDQILEGATVEPPARGTSSPAGRTMQHRRVR
ncbi:hypothetical protein H0O01_02150 [Candidatus Micrarchaeota archaeon]|nr:hypothetical protein [Candidatus Micrarchaeota archaeon]